MDQLNFIYRGMVPTGSGFDHLYASLDGDHKVLEQFRFKKKLFKKGTVGALYRVEIEGKSVSYVKELIPYYMVQLSDGTYKSTSNYFEFIPGDKEINRQAEILKKRSLEPLSPFDQEIKKARDIYKRLDFRQREQFIANLIYKITK